MYLVKPMLSHFFNWCDAFLKNVNSTIFKVPQRPGLNKDMLLWMSDEAQKQKTSQRGRHGFIVFDEMKIQVCVFVILFCFVQQEQLGPYSITMFKLYTAWIFNVHLPNILVTKSAGQNYKNTVRIYWKNQNKQNKTKHHHHWSQNCIHDSYTPRTLRACCSQSKFRILKIRESSARALFLYNYTLNISRSGDASVSVA